ncbi:MAG: ABC transporter ATP-binding protein [Methylobacterium sp.]|nr:ABC transporter ATP-binding protein [Methylobacterium sp.]MCA3616066.1 ABC transporter ATP-binding protein [Methylobacterium sp.]MCA4911261.1 ABC transporter ATP-binding protein [Methylobacterium sp.]
MSAPLLSVENLRTSFRVGREWRDAVDDVSFAVSAGETLAIVGESGSGKSVTALSIMRLISPINGRISGSIRFEGRDLLALPEEEMRAVRGNAISMIFQEPMTSLNPVLTVGKQICEALQYHRAMDSSAAKAEAIRILDRVRIPAAAQRFGEYPHRLSGGMRQRVMIAMALACRPKILIADEPTTALDVTIQAQILDLIKALQDEEGMAVIFITHDMAVVAEIADRVAVMWKGKKHEDRPAAELFASPRHGYTKALLAAVPKLGEMDAHPRPLRFAVIDPNTGDTRVPPELAADTVSAEPAPLLEVKGLTTHFPIRKGVFGRLAGRVHAVENVSFQLRKGETLALVGESGCGKSTTGRSILRLVEPTGGVVRFAGENVGALDRSGLQVMRRRMQMIFQDPFASLNPRKMVGAAIAEPMMVHGLSSPREAEERTASLLKRVGLLPDMGQRYPHEFSGGQRQRIAIARALALSPEMVVADEAVSALDVSVKAQVLNLMLDLQAELGLAYLFISHDMAVVERVAHRIAVMYLGEIVEIGPRAEVMRNSAHPYTRKLLSAVPVPDPARRRKRGGVCVEELPSPIRAPVWRAPRTRMEEVSPGHFVQVVLD